MRRVKYWNDIFIEQGACFTWIDEDRQTIHFNGAKEGLFHQWATVSGDTVAIVENYEGQIELVEPSFIKLYPIITQMLPYMKLYHLYKILS